MSVRRILTIATMLSLTAAAQATDHNTINIEFADNATPGIVVLLSSDAAEGYLAAERTDGAASIELMTSEGEVVAITGLELTGAVEDIKYVTGWTGFIDGNPATGYISSPADTESFQFGMPTRMLLDFVVQTVSTPADANQAQFKLPDFAPMSIDSADARRLATVFSPADAGEGRRIAGGMDTGMSDPVSSPGVVAWPRLVSVCGCNPNGGYPQTVCAVWNPCSAACPSGPGSCRWYIFWVWHTAA